MGSADGSQPEETQLSTRLGGSQEANALTDLRERTNDAPCSGVNESPEQQMATILALVDELALLAADLWFAGRLDPLPLEPEPDDED
jgi:hypothetical protein